MTEPTPAATPGAERPAGRGRLFLVLLLLAGLAVAAAYRSAFFRLAEVEVTGLSRLTEERLMETADLTYGISRWIRPAALIERRLLAEPWVKLAHAEWQWDRLILSIAEREPVGLLRYHDVFYLALDEDGTVLEQVELARRGPLPVISGPVAGPALRGLPLTHPGLQDALAVLYRMAPALRAEISEIQVEDDRSLTLYMTGGATVRWGAVPDGRLRLPEVERKIGHFGEIWHKYVKRRQGCEIDLRPSGPATTSGCE